MTYPIKKLGNKEYFQIIGSGINIFEGVKNYYSTSSIKGTNIGKPEKIITFENKPSRANMYFEELTVLFAKMHQTEKVIVINKDLSKNGIFSTGFIGIKSNKEKVFSQYLYHYFLSSIFNKIKDELSSGVTQIAINNSNASKIDIPLPPLPTQKLIVQKLDSAFKNIDESINITKKNIENIEELNNSVLEKIFKESEYIEKSIDEISENVQYGYTGKTIEKGKVKYLRITDIQNNNIIWDNVPFVKIEDKEISKYSLNEGDIVFARTGATVGKSCLIDKNGVGNIFASYLIRIIGKKDILNPNYMQYFFYSIYYWEQIGFDVVGAAQPNFNGTKLKKIKIPLPPLEKQKEIVSYLDEVFEKNKVIKEGYEKKLKELEEMKQSILKEAFEGRLVKD